MRWWYLRRRCVRCKFKPPQGVCCAEEIRHNLNKPGKIEINQPAGGGESQIDKNSGCLNCLRQPVECRFPEGVVNGKPVDVKWSGLCAADCVHKIYSQFEDKCCHEENNFEGQCYDVQSPLCHEVLLFFGWVTMLGNSLPEEAAKK